MTLPTSDPLLPSDDSYPLPASQDLLISIASLRLAHWPPWFSPGPLRGSLLEARFLAWASRPSRLPILSLASQPYFLYPHSPLSHDGLTLVLEPILRPLTAPLVHFSQEAGCAARPLGASLLRSGAVLGSLLLLRGVINPRDSHPASHLEPRKDGMGYWISLCAQHQAWLRAAKCLWMTQPCSLLPDPFHSSPPNPQGPLASGGPSRHHPLAGATVCSPDTLTSGAALACKRVCVLCEL